MISSVDFNNKGESRPDKKINLLSEMIDGWNTTTELILSNAIKSKIASLVEGEDVLSGRSELDSHANMVAVGKNCWIISFSKQSVDVSAFANDVGGLKSVPIVDALLTYDCKRTLKIYLLVARNGLYVESMLHNLIPPFMMREAGLIVNDMCKIHAQSVSEDNHTIQDPKSGLVINLQLDGIFSVFKTRMPNDLDFENDTDPVVLTPEGKIWNPYCKSFAKTESSFTDNKGDLVPSEYVHQELIDESDLDHDTLDC